MKLLTECNLGLLVSEILSGKTLVFPTETSYGLGCDATNQNAVDKIFKIKRREDNKSLLIVVQSVEDSKKYIEWNDLVENLANKYWPGPLTIVAKAKKGELASGVVAKDGTVAVRVSAHSFIRSLTRVLNKPLVATSANISNSANIYSADEIIEQFKNKNDQPDLVLDYGKLPVHPPTTIIKVLGERFEIIRQGEVNVDLS